MDDRSLLNLRGRFALVLGLAALLPCLASAADVRVVGVTPGRSASVSIDGGVPFHLEIGETIEDVTLLSTDRDGAELRIDGSARYLPLEASSGSAMAVSGSSSVKLTADVRGHFLTKGAINGRSIRFLVDTGASAMALSRDQAERIGLRYRDGQVIRASTANGISRGWRVVLDSVTVGNVTINDVEGVVLDNHGMPQALLGMSFLNHFDMQRQGSTLVLRRRH